MFRHNKCITGALKWKDRGKVEEIKVKNFPNLIKIIIFWSKNDKNSSTKKMKKITSWYIISKMLKRGNKKRKILKTDREKNATYRGINILKQIFHWKQ